VGHRIGRGLWRYQAAKHRSPVDFKSGPQLAATRQSEAGLQSGRYGVAPARLREGMGASNVCALDFKGAAHNPDHFLALIQEH
jgi:hypothetical protein